MRRLLQRTASWHPPRPATRAAYISQLGGIVQLYPVDLKLPALARASAATEMRRVLASALPPVGSPVRDCGVVLVRYKPTMRAVLRYTLGGE